MIQIPNDACLNCYETAQRLAEPGSDFCAKCAAELAEMQERNKTAEEKALAELRRVIDTLRARNHKLNWELANEALHEKRLEQIWQHFTWMDQLLEAAAKV